MAIVTASIDLSSINFRKSWWKAGFLPKEAVAAYEGAAGSKDADIKSFSEQMLPISKEKLRLAEKMTGAGMKAAKSLFRTGAKPPAATPAVVTPASTAPSPIPPPVAPPPAPGR